MSHVDSTRVAKKLLDAENAYHAAQRRHETEHSDEAFAALAEPERALKALESWAE